MGEVPESHPRFASLMARKKLTEAAAAGLLADSALIDLAISLAKLIILFVCVPGAGSSSYKVTTGPGFIPMTSASIL